MAAQDFFQQAVHVSVVGMDLFDDQYGAVETEAAHEAVSKTTESAMPAVSRHQA